MTQQDSLNYQRIAQAIDYLRAHYKDQPSLDDVAAAVHLSPHHFQRLFAEWAGVSPKKFVQYLSLSHAKSLLREEGTTLFDAALDTGLSGTGRLHHLFVTIEGMTPAEWKRGGEGLEIHYAFAHTHYGLLIAAATAKGLCYLAFAEEETAALEGLTLRFPFAGFRGSPNEHCVMALSIFRKEYAGTVAIRLHLQGTPFQLRVWEALLRIPSGRVTTYGRLAAEIESPGASRAVGTAVGANPVAYIIPCHRVIQSSGVLGGYRWGETRKAAMLGREASPPA